MFDGLKTRKQVRELEEEMLKLTRIVEAHDLEWTDMRARCKRLLDRTEKAAKRLETDVESETSGDIPQNGEGEGLPALSLSPSQQRLNQQILRQRRKVQ